MCAYSNFDWAGDTVDRKSTTSYCTFLGGSLISWKSKKQSSVSRSSLEAEYRAMTTTTAEIVWLRWLLVELGVPQLNPTPMYYGNQSAIQIACNPVFHERTKHIEIDCHFVRHQFLNGVLYLPYTPSASQLADFFTKSHTVQCFRPLLSKLLLVLPS